MTLSYVKLSENNFGRRERKRGKELGGIYSFAEVVVRGYRHMHVLKT